MSEQYIDIVFHQHECDGGTPEQHFVEVENENGESIRVGDWIENGDGYRRLRIHTERGINSIAKYMHQIAVDKGWWDPDLGPIKTPIEQVALWMSECAEAIEEIRDDTPLDRVWYRTTLEASPRGYPEEAMKVYNKIMQIHREIDHFGADAVTEDRMPTKEEWRVLVEAGIAKPEGFGIEAADVVIRIMDSLEKAGISLYEMIELKSTYNRTRQPRHGKVI